MKRVFLLSVLVFTFNTVFAQKALKILKKDGSITYINASAVDRITFVTPLAIGDTYEGGIIFYLDPNGQHGLIVAPYDQVNGDPFNWSYTTSNTGATGDAVGAGEENTNKIVYKLGNAGIAAKICYDLTLGGYSDWYLPSKYELNLIYTNLVQHGLGNFGNNAYWSSTEKDTDNAWFQNLGSGAQTYGLKYSNSFLLNVRAVRAF